MGRPNDHRKKPPTHQQVPHPKPAQTLLTPMSGSLKSVLVKVPGPSHRIRPGANFYRACNEEWLKTTSLPAYRTTYGVSEELEDYLEGFLFQIARDATVVARSGTKPRTQEEKAEDAIGRLVLSAMRPEKQRESVETLKRGLRGTSCIRDMTDVANTLGAMIRYGVPTLLDIGVDVTFYRGAHRQILQIGPGSLGLPDPRYYLPEGQAGITLQAATALKEYRGLLGFVAKEFDLGIDLGSAVSTEVELAKPLVAARDETEIVVVEISELRSKFSAIPWDALFAAIHLDHVPHRIGLLSLNWLGILNSFFERLPLEQWIPLLTAHSAVHGIQFLPPPFDSHHFDLFGKLLAGQAQKIPQHILTMNVLRTTMSEYLSFFFIKRFLGPEEKAKATHFVETLFKATEVRLRETPWMETASRNVLIRKIRAMKRSIFYPDPVGPPKFIPDLQTDIFLANIYLLNGTNFDRELERLKTQRDIGRSWDEPVYTVNAYYYTDANQIVLPAGYFFWPFYDPQRLGWSYGGLGSILGHEIIHAFDEEGKEIDEKGIRRTLWSKKDQRAYEGLLSKIIRLYNQAKVGEIHINGKATASENLADLGGVAIALDALEGLLKGRPAVERLRELRDFFWSYAVSWRTKVREKKALQDVFMDKHAPPEVRVNFVVAQMDAWYEAFGIQTADPMYIPPEERLRIF